MRHCKGCVVVVLDPIEYIMDIESAGLHSFDETVSLWRRRYSLRVSKVDVTSHHKNLNRVL
jgi:hypothetical protein